jgi:hypothetical protein
MFFKWHTSKPKSKSEIKHHSNAEIGKIYICQKDLVEKVFKRVYTGKCEYCEAQERQDKIGNIVKITACVMVFICATVLFLL